MQMQVFLSLMCFIIKKQEYKNEIFHTFIFIFLFFNSYISFLF